LPVLKIRYLAVTILFFMTVITGCFAGNIRAVIGFYAFGNFRMAPIAAQRRVNMRFMRKPDFFTVALCTFLFRHVIVMTFKTELHCRESAAWNKFISGNPLMALLAFHVQIGVHFMIEVETVSGPGPGRGEFLQDILLMTFPAAFFQVGKIIITGLFTGRSTGVTGRAFHLHIHMRLMREHPAVLRIEKYGKYKHNCRRYDNKHVSSVPGHVMSCQKKYFSEKIPRRS
jgi:hypothetical protein